MTIINERTIRSQRAYMDFLEHIEPLLTSVRCLADNDIEHQDAYKEADRYLRQACFIVRSYGGGIGEEWNI